MICLQREGDGVRLTVRCQRCGHTIALKEAWLCFAVCDTTRSGGRHPGTYAPGFWTHRTCVDGVLPSGRYVLYRGVSAVETLLRQC